MTNIQRNNVLKILTDVASHPGIFPRKKFGELILPSRYVEIKGPVIFLAGPIRGAVNWRDEAISCIRNRNPKLHIASPRKPALTHGEPIDWEHHYLQRAGENGVILFWLAKEADHRCDRSYAQTTRFELGEATVMHRFTNIKVVVGIEEGFTGGEYIRKTLAKKYPDIPICDTLKQTCEVAVQLAERNSAN